MKKICILFVVITAMAISCTSTSEKKEIQEIMDNKYLPKPWVELTHPEWSKDATIYEVNIRQ